MRTFLNYYTVWKQFGGLPEFYNIPQGYTVEKREGYPLRPGKYEYIRSPFAMRLGCRSSYNKKPSLPQTSLHSLVTMWTFFGSNVEIIYYLPPNGFLKFYESSQ